MVNKDKIKADLDLYFSVENISDTLFRCSRLHKEKPYQIIYVDISEDVPFNDIDSYLKKNIAQDYFLNKGPLQWNFYLIFITDNIFEDDEKNLIEGNPDYARKLLIKSDEFMDWLNRSYINSDVENSGVEMGLSDIWRNHLRDNNLDFILFDKITLNAGVHKVLNEDKDEIFQTQIQKDFDSKDIDLGQLRVLDPGNFREYPIHVEPFEFKQVNLIDGANGFGKTSLLESIEFFFTGKNLRSDESPKECNIRAKFEADENFKTFQYNSALFRERDKVWYKGVRLIRGNELNLHFNHFNFYNTDTAFRLSFSKAGISDVDEAFEAIALGEEVNLIKRQIANYQSRFFEEIKSRQKDINNLNDDIHKEEELISGLQNSNENDIVLIESVYDKAKELQLNLTEQKTSSSLDDLKSELIAVASEINQLIKFISWAEEISYNQLLSEENTLDRIRKNVVDFLAVKSNNEKLIYEAENDLTNSISLEALLSELLLYYRHDVSLFSNLSENITRTELQLERLKLISGKHEQIFKILDSTSNLIVIATQTQQDKILSEKKIEYSNLLSQIEITENTLSKVNSLMTKIKSDGKLLLSLEKEQANCPLCQTNFITNQALLSAIIKQVDSTIKTESLDLLLTTKIQKEKQIQDLTNYLAQIGNLIEIIEFFPELKADDKLNFATAFNLIEKELRSLNQIKEQLSKLKAFQEKIKLEGLSENRFVDIKKQHLIKFANLTLSQSLIEKEILEEKNTQLKLTQLIENYRSSILLKEADVIKTLKGYNFEFDIQDLNEITERILAIKHYLSVCNRIFNPHFDKNKNIRILQLDLNTLITQIDDIKSNLEIKKRESEFIQKSKEVRAEKCNTRDLLVKEQKLLQNSLDVLNELLEKYSETEFLQKFLQKNNDELKKIFLTIHTPKEFKDVMISEGRIVLKKFNDDKKDLMSISTGQRSALALSLFLVLNNKLNKGPHVIIFDDPVAFTDDINVLSFLDYIRELILKENCKKQLFFATANENLSFLFQKKFEILGDEFNHITLKR